MKRSRGRRGFVSHWGGTSLGYGVRPQRAGLGLELLALNRVVDYPARDMTITVEAGTTIESLAQLMAQEGQRLPIDVPQAGQATLGGVVATNTSGPRRYGYGTIRDYVIGVSAVDGRGVLFKGGGRVVKNVAGYDFCKLLTGSLGTLGIITQLTLKVRPMAEASAWLACEIGGWSEADVLLDDLVNTQVAPAAIELLHGPAWQNDPALSNSTRPWLLVALEGTAIEVDWMLGQLESEWQTRNVKSMRRIEGEAARLLCSRLTEFPVDDDAPLVVKLNVLPARPPGLLNACWPSMPSARFSSCG